MVLGVAGTSFTQCGRANQFAAAMNQQGTSNVVAQIGESLITEKEVDDNFQDALKRDPTASLGSDLDQLKYAASAVNNLVQSALIIELGKKYNVQPSEEEALKLIEANANGQIQQAKAAFIAQKLIPEKPSDAEFAKAFKAQTGTDPDEYRNGLLDEARERLKHPETKLPVIASTMTQPMLEAIRKTVTVSDDELKHQNDSYEFKQITIQKGDVDATAKKVLAELKGGASFESAIDKYSNDIPENKKKLNEITHEMPRSILNAYEPYKPLQKLKKGEISDIVTIGPTRVIYKLVNIKSTPSANFEKEKASLRDSALATKATEKLLAELKEVQKNAKITWKSEGYRVVYEYGQLESTDVPKAEKHSRLVKVVDDALKAGTDTNSHFAAKWSSVVAFQALREAALDATPAEKTALEAKKLDVYQAYLQNTEDAQLRIELVKAYMEKKDGAGVVEQLIAAANANVSHPDLLGQSTFNEINKYLKLAQDANYLKPEQVKQIEDLQRQWVQAKADKDQFDAEDRKQKAEEAKRQAEYDKQAKKDADAAAKAAADAKKSQPKDAPKTDGAKPPEGPKGK